MDNALESFRQVLVAEICSEKVWNVLHSIVWKTAFPTKTVLHLQRTLEPVQPSMIANKSVKADHNCNAKRHTHESS